MSPADFAAFMVVVALILGGVMLLGDAPLHWLDRLMHWIIVRPQERAAARRYRRLP